MAIATDGQECIALVTALRPDLITLDVGLPGIDGLEVIGGLSSIGMITAPGVARRLAEGDPGPFAAERLA